MRPSQIILKIRELIFNGKYEITLHADEEAQEDNVNISDIKKAIETGEIIKKFTQDVRGTRYKINGLTNDGGSLNVIVRFNSIGEVRILTVFV